MGNSSVNPFFKSMTYEYVSCNLCNANDFEFISNKGHFDLPVNLVVCKNCGLGYLNPRWDKNSYSNFYKDEYDKYYRPSINNKITYEIKPQLNFILERLKFIKGLKYTSKNILDIGSGDGLNLKAFGFAFPNSNLYAIEPSTTSQKILKKFNIAVISDDVDKAWDHDYQNHFDLIIMRHVLEHFLNPSEVLKKVYHTLKDNGILYVAVPNNLITNRNNGWLRTPHTYYFNKYTLENILKKHSLSPINICEGDKFSSLEIFAFVKKSTDQIIWTNSREQFHLQKKAFKTTLRKERISQTKQKIFFFIKNSLRKLLNLFKTESSGE